MLTSFVVVGGVLAYLIRRPRWQKVVLVVSTVPIAIVCNLVRLVITGFLFLELSSEAAERFFHDFAGWTMMPMAFALMFLELWLMAWIVVPEDRAAPVPEAGTPHA
jgi:exosortase/archaeosortase family protein